MESKKVEFFNKLSFITLLGALFCSLFFFIPFISVSLGASKGFLMSVGVTLSMFFWLIARLGEGKFTIPKDRLILFAGLIPIVFLISSFFSPSLYTSLFGSGFEIGTFGSMLILFCIFFLSTVYFQTEKRLWSFFGSLFIGATVLAVFELFNIFVGFNRFAPSLLKGLSSGNLIGSWNDFALFFGLITVLCMFTIEFLKTKGISLIIEYFLLIVGVFFLIIINTQLVWILVGLFSVIIFVYSISLQHAGVSVVHNGEGKKKFPFAALVVVFICLLFLISSTSISSLVSKYVNLQNTDIRPSITTTFQIAYHALKHNPVLGTGPNTFVMDWSLWQPKAIAETIYWDVDFSSGFSSLNTFLATTGILGFLVLILFIVIVFIRGIQSLKIALQNTLSNYFIFATLIIATYSWIVIILYNTNIIMFSLAFASSGVLIGILVYKKVIPVRQLSFLNDPRNSFFVILGLMILMVGTLSITYIYIEKFTSIIYYSKSLNSDNTSLDSLTKSERMLRNAIVLDKNDIYYRSLSQVYISQIGVLVNDKTLSADVLKSDLQALVTSAQEAATLAVNQNPKQYLNYVNLGDVYSSFVPLSIATSYENAMAAYNKASGLAPNNPSIYLSKASLEFLNKNNTEARKYIAQALELKSNYTDAIFFLAQIEMNEGNLSEAINQAERAGDLSPDDPTVFFRLGLLRYNNSDYSGSVSAFEKAVILDNTYLNARYFLAQSYGKVGRTSDAMAQYKILDQLLPNNQTIKDAMNSLSTPTLPAVIQTPDTINKTTTKTPTKKIKPPLPEKQ